MIGARKIVATGTVLAAMVVGTILTVEADDPAAQCTANANNHFGIVAPWDGACWAGAAENITHFVTNDIATTVTRWVYTGAAEATGFFLKQFTASSTRPAFTTPWFDRVYYGDVQHQYAGSSVAYPGQPGALEIAELIAVPLLVLTILAGVLRGDIGGALKTVFVRLPLVIVLCFLVLAVLSRVFDVVDVLSGWIAGTSVSDFQQWTSKFNPDSIAGDFVVVVVSLVIIIASLLAYIELFVRSAVLYLVVAFLPIIAMATLWQGSRSALKKTVEVIAVLTASKLVMAFAFMVGAGALTSGDGSQFAPLLVGAVIFGVIALAPFALFALVPIVEAAGVAAVAGMGTGAGLRGLAAGRRHGTSALRSSASAVSHSPDAARGAARGVEPVGNRLRGALGLTQRRTAAIPAFQLAGTASHPSSRPTDAAGGGAADPSTVRSGGPDDGAG